jgi:hypothetical protein
MIVKSSLGGVTMGIPMKDRAGRDVFVAIVKLTYAVSPAGRVELLAPAESAPIDLADTHHGPDPARASIARPSQVFDEKPGTDLVVLGHAHPRPGRPSTHVDVEVRMGPLHKVVRAHGPRVFQSGGLAPGPAMPVVEPVRLAYENAWGGVDDSDPMRPRGELRNTVGRGVARDPKALAHTPAPQLEHPDKPIVGGANNVPASFGPVHRHWLPRASFVGTYDEAWRRTRMPLLPLDFDPRHHVCVPHDQWSQQPLRGDEPVSVTGATPEGTLRFGLPRVAVGFSSMQHGGRFEHRTWLDTVLLDLDAMKVELTFRASVPMPRKLEQLAHVRAFAKKVV